MIHKDRATSLDHLARVESTLKPYELPYLDLLLAMLTIQRAFINHVNESGYTGLDHVTFDATGFPELPSWLADLNGAFEQFEQSRRNRAGAIGPLLKSFTNVSPAEIKANSQKAAREINASHTLAGAIGLLTSVQQKYLSGSARLQPDSFPFSVKTDNPGVLTARSAHSKFNTLQSTGARTLIKYVDMPHSSPPGYFTLYVIPGSRLAPTIHVLQPKANPVKADESITKHPTLDQIENYNPALLRALYGLDSTTTKPETVSSFVSLLPIINKFIIDFSAFYRIGVLSGKAVTGDEFDLKTNEFATRMAEIYSHLDNDTVRTSVQIAIADALAPVMEEAEKLKNSPLPGSVALATITPPAPEKIRGLTALLRRREPNIPTPPKSDLLKKIEELEAKKPKR